jgi:hypothetical protein
MNISKKWLTRKENSLPLTIIVCLLEVHVKDASGESARHVAAEDGANLGEFAGLDGVAAILSEKGWHGVFLEFLDTLIVARFGERRVAAPGVDVVSPKVNGLCWVTAVEVIGHVLSDLVVVVGSISNVHLPVVLGLDVRLHVPDSCLDESTGARICQVV